MKNFNLWLDESGSFEDDRLAKGWKPSLVGGALWEDGTFDEKIANRILGKKSKHEKVHFVEEKDSQRAIDVLKASSKAGVRFVIIQNKERLKIIDNDTTYLNVLAEGIMQLISDLLSEYKVFKLSINIATRKNMVTGNGIITKDEYTRRLQEKIILLNAKKSLYTLRDSKWKYSIEFEDAREDGRLQIADCICNSFLTQDATKKFNEEQRQTLHTLFNSTYRYSVLSKETVDEYKGLIAKENYGEVIFSLFCETDEDVLAERDKLTKQIVRKMANLNINVIKNNLSQVMAHVDTLIEYDKNFSLAEIPLKNIQDQLIPAIRAANMDVSEFSFNVALYLYAIYTHRGSKEGYNQDVVCVEELKKIDDLFMRLKCFYQYSNRKSIHLKNMFDFQGSLKAITDVICIADQMKDALQLISNIEIVLPGDKSIKSDELAKSYGTRLQMWPLLWSLSPQKKYIEKAEKDYQQALDNFSLEQDKERQYLYLSIMKTICGDFKGALTLVLQSEGVQYTSEGCLDQFLQALKSKPFQSVEYKYLAYFRIMAYAKAVGDSLGDFLHEKLNKNSIPIMAFQAQHDDYPVNMIYWFYAQYQSKQSVKEAVRYYDKALQMKLNSEDFTMSFITLGILAAKILAKPQQCQESEAEFDKRVNRVISELGDEGKAYWQCLVNKDWAEIVRRSLMIG